MNTNYREGLALKSSTNKVVAISAVALMGASAFTTGIAGADTAKENALVPPAEVVAALKEEFKKMPLDPGVTTPGEDISLEEINKKQPQPPEEVKAKLSEGFSATRANLGAVSDVEDTPLQRLAQEGAVANAVSAGCRLHTWPAGQGNNWLGVQGGRFDCWNQVGFQVELKKERWWWYDQVLAVAHGYGNGAVVAYHPCAGSGVYYGNTKSSTGNELEGARRGLC